MLKNHLKIAGDDPVEAAPPVPRALGSAPGSAPWAVTALHRARLRPCDIMTCHDIAIDRLYRYMYYMYIYICMYVMCIYIHIHHMSKDV